MCSTRSPRAYRSPAPRPGHSSSSRMTTSGLRPEPGEPGARATGLPLVDPRAGAWGSPTPSLVLRVRPGPTSAGSKKYVAAVVATTLTAWPSAVRASWRAGTRTAATLPVAPSRTLAIGRALLVQVLDRQHQPVGQLPPRHPLVAVLPRPDVRPVRRPVERVGHHQVGVGLLPRGLGDPQQLVLADPDFELELDQHPGEPPRLAEPVDQLRGPHQPHPQLRLGALDLAGLQLRQRRRPGPGLPPAGAGVEERAGFGGERPGGKEVA